MYDKTLTRHTGAFACGRDAGYAIDGIRRSLPICPG